MFRKWLFLVLLIAAMALADFAVGSASSAKAGEVPPVKIAFFGSISGVNSETGRQGILGMKAAQQYVNDNGGIKALGGAKIEVVLIDGTSDPAQAVLPLERGLSPGGISGIVGSSQSALALISLPILQKYKVPAVTGAAANGAITQKGCEFIFQPAARAPQFGGLQLDFLRFIAPKMGKTVQDLKCAVIFENSAWGEDNAKSNRKVLKDAGMTIAVDENYEAGKLSDASPIITKLKNADVDVVFPSCYANDAKLLMTAMNSMKYKPLIIAGGAAFTWPSLLNDLGDDVNGICSADGWIWDNKNTSAFPEYNAVRERYEKENGEFIAGHSGPTIVSFMLIVDAIEKGKSADPISVRDQLRKLNAGNSPWFKAYYANASFDDKGFNAGSTPFIMQWQNSRPRCVYPPEFASSEVVDPFTLKPFAK